MESKGSVAIYFVLVILSGVLLITGILSYLMVGEMKLARDVGFSSGAYQAADSGMEFILLAKKNSEKDTLDEFENFYSSLPSFNATNHNWMCSGVDIYWWPVGNCYYCLDINGPITDIQSIGKCGEVRRAIRVTY